MLGLEPRTYGLKGRSDRTVTSEHTTTYDNSDPALTALLTDIARIDPNLAAIVRSWLTLTEQARADILAIVQASKQGQGAKRCK